MKKGLIKSTFREIKESLGRYMAILLIVALGVGFFSGLKVAYSAMLYTADTYLKEQNFYDYHLLSTMGFDEDTAEYLEEKAEDAVLTAANVLNNTEACPPRMDPGSCFSYLFFPCSLSVIFEP